MIISASRRTDIPTWYADWFFRRLEEGFVLVRNPMNRRQVGRVALNPEVVDGIVFWTKNPVPMLDKLDRLRDYPYVFQFTVNGYGTDIEQNIPDKEEVILPAFRRLSGSIGPERVLWRYDPILLSDVYTVEYHLRCFEGLAKRLSPYTRRCTISFLDLYRDTEKNCRGLFPRAPSPEEQELLGRAMAEMAHGFGLEIVTCAEAIDLSRYGVGHAACIDSLLFSRFWGRPLEAGRDKNQRPGCGCAESVDIGAYGTCGNGCRYCYANRSRQAALANLARHCPASPMLIGEPEAGDRVTERKIVSFRAAQTRLDV